MTHWQHLDRELDHWEKEQRQATCWWRNDDAMTPLGEESVIATARRWRVPVAMAVIPCRMESSLVGSLNSEPLVSVLFHGLHHVSYSGPGEVPSEYPHSRGRAEMSKELDHGLALLSCFQRSLPVLVPPWDNVSAKAVEIIAECGYRGVSTCGWRETAEPAPGVIQNNVHADPLEWSPVKFRGVEETLTAFIGHLAARREGRADSSEATGLVTHGHLHGADVVGFLDEFLARTCRHPAIRWLDAADVFGCRAAAS